MLSPQARLVLTTLVPAQAHPTLRIGLSDAGIDEFWSDFERTAAPAPRMLFGAAIFTATWIAPLLIRRPPPLGRLDGLAREKALAALETSRVPVLRQMLAFLKTMAAFCYGANPEVRAAIGYPQPLARPDEQAAP